MGYFGKYASRLNEAAIKHLSDGLCTFHPGGGAAPVEDVPYQFDNAFEVFDENGLADFVRTVLLPKARVSGGGRGDEITIDTKVWKVAGLIEDDGSFIRVQVQT